MRKGIYIHLKVGRSPPKRDKLSRCGVLAPELDAGKESECHPYVHSKQ